MHVDMTSYEKIYDLKAENELPERIFLDKGTSYSFSVFLTARKPEVLHGRWAGPGWWAQWSGRGLWGTAEWAGPV